MKSFKILAIAIIITSQQAWATSPIRSWATDMYNQPSVKSFSANSQLSFPIGSVTTDGIVISTDGYTDVVGTALPWADFSPTGFRYNPALTPSNPVAKSAESIDQGKYLYTVYCASCHGDNADSQTTIGQLRAVPVIKALVPLFTEGYIFLRITHGGPNVISMPPLGYALSTNERWEVINYIKSAFK